MPYRRKLALLLLLAASASIACAEKRVTVDEAEGIFSESQRSPDVKLARKIAGLQLTQRVSPARLANWRAQMQGPESLRALRALADAAEFFDLPPEDLPHHPAPDAAAGKQIFARTVDYVGTAIHQLPNFTAQRTTLHFDDAPPMLAYIDDKSQMLKPQPLIFDDRDVLSVFYLNGREVAQHEQSPDGQFSFFHADPSVDRSLPDNPGKPEGLTTSGEFGPVLSIVVEDADRSGVQWSHWEQGASGLIAVFTYSVPQDASHYSVTFTDVAQAVHSQVTAYHGQIAVDPANGAILRITAEAEIHPPHGVFNANIAVEYGRVSIGGRSYICPVHGVAFSRFTEVKQGPHAATLNVPYLTHVNDVEFTRYQVFRSEARILP